MGAQILLLVLKENKVLGLCTKGVEQEIIVSVSSWLPRSCLQESSTLSEKRAW